jgi:hypothetical protein
MRPSAIDTVSEDTWHLTSEIPFCCCFCTRPPLNRYSFTVEETVRMTHHIANTTNITDEASATLLPPMSAATVGEQRTSGWQSTSFLGSLASSDLPAGVSRSGGRCGSRYGSSCRGPEAVRGKTNYYRDAVNDDEKRRRVAGCRRLSVDVVVVVGTGPKRNDVESLGHASAHAQWHIRRRKEEDILFAAAMHY